MIKPQHICLLALLSTANGLITLPSSALQRQSIQSPCSSALQYQEDAFVDVEILNKVDLIRFESGTVGVIGRSNSSPETSSTYRDIRIPMEWYPQQQMRDVNSDSSSCSAYRRQDTKGTVIVRIIEWKKQAGDVVKQGDIMVVLEKSHIDCYGRTVDKHHIEVASKDDGILKSILIPQNCELNLNKRQFQSSIALFHPTEFHCIEIDEITRMDTTLLLIDETEPPDKEATNDANDQDLSLSSETIGTFQEVAKTDIGNGTCTTLEKNIQEEMILEEEAMPAASNVLLDFVQDVENCMNSTAESNHTIGEEELTFNATVLEANARDIAQSAINATNACSTRQDGSSQEQVVCKESEHESFPSEPNTLRSLDPKLEEIAERKHGIASTTILKGQETVPATGDDVALEEHHADTQNDPESSLALLVDDEELDLERIVDIAAKIVAEVLFGEASTNNPTYDSASGPDDAEPANDVSITVEEAWEDIQITHSSSCEDGEGTQATIDFLETEEVWGSQKAQVFDAVMDFFTTTFQKTN